MQIIEIQPELLGDLEVGWWRAHNDKDKKRMMELLIEYTVAFYQVSSEDAKAALQHWINGVKQHDVREWEQAVLSVEQFYTIIKDKTEYTFDPRGMAELEVGWWHLHDELEHNPDKSSLATAFAKLYAVQFSMDTESMAEVGRLKAEATREHDLAEKEGISEDDAETHWNNANRLLIECYAELKRVLED